MGGLLAILLAAGTEAVPAQECFSASLEGSVPEGATWSHAVWESRRVEWLSL